MAELAAVVSVGGFDNSSRVLRIERESQLAVPGQKASVLFREDFGWEAIAPWDSLEIYEQGTLVFTGFVENIIVRRPPKEIEVKGRDTFKLAQDWFIGEQLETGENNETVGYWVGYLCGLCGLSYAFTSGSANEALILDEGIDLGLRSVAEALQQICSIAQFDMRVNPSGVLEIFHLDPAVFPADHTLDEILELEDSRNDYDTRNRVVVWGTDAATGEPLLYQESRVVDDVPDTRTMVFASPVLNTTERAQALADVALDRWATIERVIEAVVIGDPGIQIADKLLINHSVLTSGSALDYLTDMRSVMSEQGYEQNLTLGRRSVHYPHFPITPTPEPPITWPTSGFLGRAYDIMVVGSFIYAAGYGFYQNTFGTRRVWRVERRSTVDGALDWGIEIDVTPAAPSTETQTSVRALYVTEDAIYLAGVHQETFFGALTWRVERRDLNGAFVWARSFTPGQATDITVVGSTVYCTGRSSDGITAAGLVLLGAADGAILAAVDLSAEGEVTADNGTVDPLASIDGLSDHIILGSRWNPQNISGSGRWWLSAFDLSGTQIWEQRLEEADSSPGPIVRKVLADEANGHYYRLGNTSSNPAAESGLAQHDGGDVLWFWDDAGFILTTQTQMFEVGMTQDDAYIYMVEPINQAYRVNRKSDGASIDFVSIAPAILHGLYHAGGYIYVCGTYGNYFYVNRRAAQA